MDVTPKLQRKASLSLSTRLNKKRHSASPQNRLKFSSNAVATSETVNTNCEERQSVSSVIPINSEGGIESTPPHKKWTVNLDDSFEFSPKAFDSSFSPTCLLSQTLAIDSPEVGWKWSRNSRNGSGSNLRCEIDSCIIDTPDSAYAADSSFTSAASSSTEVNNNRTRSYSSKKRYANDARRDQRKMFEQQLRRVEKTRADEKLKERCAKLQEQLKSAGTPENKSPVISYCGPLKYDEMTKSQPNDPTSMVIKSDKNIKKPKSHENSDLISDFFNDSDLDSFLLEATQEIESKIGIENQSVRTAPKPPNSSEYSPRSLVNSAPAASTSSATSKSVSCIENSTAINAEKEKRSSFYMKFLEDDFPDEWFLSLDEVILQATQNKKPRTSLHRYKSMPAETIINANATSKKGDSDKCTINSKINSNNLVIPSKQTAASPSKIFNIKRHCSTHSLSSTRANNNLNNL